MTVTFAFLRNAGADQIRTLPNDKLLEARRVLRAERDVRLGSLERISRAAGDRPLTRAQQNDYDDVDRVLTEVRSVAEQVEDAIASASMDRRGVVPPAGADGVHWAGDPIRSDGGEYRDGLPLGRGQTFTGFARSKGMIRDDAADEQLSLRKCLRGVILGDWDDADLERRAMSESVLAGGGYMVPTVLAAEIVDLARNQTRVMQAGARLFPMANKRVDVAKWVSDPSMAFHSEGAAISPSDATIGTVQLNAKALAGLTLVSRELLEDASEVESELRQAFASVLALKVDQASLYGTGVDPEPRGVRNTSGILTASMGANGAALTNYDPVIDAVGCRTTTRTRPGSSTRRGRRGRWRS